MRPGTVIGGFQVRRLIGRGSRGAVYEGLQLSLERPVALRLLEPKDFEDAEDESRFLAQQRLAAALHHPGIVPTYEAGEWEGGRFVATRYVRGRTLAEALAGGDVSREDGARLLDQLDVALAAAHGAGLVHGRISARNVLIDRSGAALLPDLGLGRAGTKADDEAALAELRELVERDAGARRRPRRLVLPALAIAAASAAAAVLLVASGSADQDLSAEVAPPVAAGTEPVGSGLAPGTAESVGCAADPGPNTPVCTLAQSTLGGESARVREAGAIRGWAVRNASGDMALQVIGFRGGRPFLRSFSQYESVHDLGPHSFATDIRVGRGDVVGVTLAPGAAVGARAGGREAEAAMWSGTLPYTPQRTESSDLDEELLLRVDVAPDARPVLVQTRGRRAAAAPDGAALAAQVARAPGGMVVRTELTRVGDELAIDSVEGGTRLARAEVVGAEADGRLLSFSVGCGFQHGVCLRWQNEGDPQPVVHAYRLTPEGAFRQIG